MNLDYPQKSNGMYKLHPPDFDDIALKLLKKYLSVVVDSPREIDINFLIKECFYLDIYSKRLSADKSILGLIAFEDTSIPCYNLRFEPTSFDLIAGNIVIDLSLSGQNQLARRRFTLAHEFSHWILHRSFHSPTNQVFAFNKRDFLSCGESNYNIGKKVLTTDSDREEWQANSLAAAILMPKIAFLTCACRELYKQFGATATTFNKESNPLLYKTALESISYVFNVSMQATEIRLDTLNLLA